MIVNETSLIPVGDHVRATVSNTVVLTVEPPDGASVLLIQADTNNDLLMTVDFGMTDPVNTGGSEVGFRLDNNAVPQFFYLYPRCTIKLISGNSAASAVVNYQWFKPAVR